MPATFNAQIAANPALKLPLVVFASSRNVPVDTQLTSWFGTGGAQVLADAGNIMVLRVSTRSGTFGSNSWNGNLCCCWSTSSDGAAVDDSTYLSDAVQKVIDAQWPVDVKAVFGGGDSAGEGVLFRSACDHAATWAGIWGFAGAGGVTTGAGGTDPACSPSQHVHLLKMHGFGDNSAEPYTGTQAPNGGMPNACNSAIDTGDTIDQYLAFNGCSALTLTTASWAQLDGTNQTDLYDGTGCPSDGTVQHWKMLVTAHTITSPTTAFRTKILDWMAAHHRP